MEQFITIKAGDAATITETITGLKSLSGYTAKLYIRDHEKVLIEKEAVIIGMVATYEIMHDDTKELVPGTYDFETKIYDGDDHVYSQSYGIFEVR